MRVVVAALLLALACIAPPVVATGGGYSYSTTSTYAGTTSHSKSVPWVHRDAHGKIARTPDN